MAMMMKEVLVMVVVMELDIFFYNPNSHLILGFFLLPYTASPGFEPTSVEFHQTGTYRTLYRLSYRAAAMEVEKRLMV